MGAKYLWILTVFLIACASTPFNTVPTEQFSFSNETETQAEVNPCALILCAPGKTCSNGTCVCPEKTCNEECVSKDTCCTNADCGSGKACTDGACVEKPICKLGEDFTDGKCSCDDNHFYCGAQGRCIPRGKCCEHTECPRFERCVPYLSKTRLCVQEADKKICKLFPENGRDELFVFNQTILRVNTADFFSDKSVQFNVSGELLTLKTNVSSAHSNLTLYQEGAETLGGYCKPDEDEEEEDE